MSKLISIHALVLGSAVAGQTESIEPGHRFEATESEHTYLLSVGAAREARKEDVALPEFVRAGAGSAKGTGKPAAADLSKMSKAELIAVAEEEEIVIDQSATNKAIAAVIEAARKAAAEDSLV